MDNNDNMENSEAPAEEPPILHTKMFRNDCGNIIGKVTQFGIILRHRDKQSNTQANKKGKRKREEIGKERANKTARVKWGRGKREANGK